MNEEFFQIIFCFIQAIVFAFLACYWSKEKYEEYKVNSKITRDETFWLTISAIGFLIANVVFVIVLINRAIAHLF